LLFDGKYGTIMLNKKPSPCGKSRLLAVDEAEMNSGIYLNLIEKRRIHMTWEEILSEW